MDGQLYWLGLTLLPGIGAKRIHQLVTQLGNPERVWHASQTVLRDCGISDQIIRPLLAQRAKIDLNAEMLKIRKAGAYLIAWNDDGYPPLLRQLDDAPPVLYIKGDLLPQDTLSIAVVGTRSATRYGLDVAFRLSRDLAAQHVTVVSGLALGIDTAAHKGALEARGRTIAVQGCGIDVVYPRENYDLLQRITQFGAVLTEFPIGTPPTGNNFPRRNRILSGMTRGVLVVEAPEQSGALITGREAADQGREVFAVPGNIFNPMSKGVNRLIQDGAKLVMDVKDILDELQVAVMEAETRTAVQAILPESPTETTLLQLLEADPVHIDILIQTSGLPASEVAATLMMLELKGLAQNVGAMQYCRTH